MMDDSKPGPQGKIQRLTYSLHFIYILNQSHTLSTAPETELNNPFYMAGGTVCISMEWEIQYSGSSLHPHEPRAKTQTQRSVQSTFL